jgi:hypothetical protein
MQQWHTISVKLNETQRNALKALCRQENNKKVNQKLRELIEHEIAPLLDPAVLPQNQGYPLAGENRFVYDQEKDNFIWQLDMGEGRVIIMAQDVTFAFLKNMKRAVDAGVQAKETADKKISRKKTRVPKGVLKYKVK